MPRRESVEAKADRLLAEGRLTIERADPHGVVVARCQGDHGEYMLGYDVKAKEWRCGCVARKECSHIVALKKVAKR